MDWTKTGYLYEVAVNVVHQTNVDYTLGTLSGVQLEGLSVTDKYDSDSRVQAKVTTMMREGESDGYIKNARLRIILTIPEQGWSEELITGYVSDVDEDDNHQYIKRTYTIEGTIWGLLEHKTKDPITISKGAKMLNVWTSLLSSQTKMQYNIDGAQDHSFNNTILYEPGVNLSTVLFELSESYDRMGVDGHGRITLRKYTAPSKQTPTRVINFNDVRNLVMLPLAKTSTEYEAPGRAVVTSTISKTVDGKTVQEVIAGSYDAPQTHPTSIHVRGWLSGRTDSYSGLSENPSKSELNEVAKKNWENAQDKGIEWSCTSVFRDYHAGEVVTLILPVSNDAHQLANTYKVLVQTVTTDLNSFTQDLTLKEV